MSEYCSKCNGDAMFFHSKCCNAHFEGMIKNGEKIIVCEKCEKYCAALVEEQNE